jgi:hypothetical protein
MSDTNDEAPVAAEPDAIQEQRVWVSPEELMRRIEALEVQMRELERRQAALEGLS